LWIFHVTFFLRLFCVSSLLYACFLSFSETWYDGTFFNTLIYSFLSAHVFFWFMNILFVVWCAISAFLSGSHGMKRRWLFYWWMNLFFLVTYMLALIFWSSFFFPRYFFFFFVL
jgi:hypothetical protein